MPFVPGALIATAASNVPGLLSKEMGFTVTCKLPGKLPAVGFTMSHGVPLLVVGVAVKLLTLKVEVDRETVCVIAAVLLGAKTKLSEFGFAEMGLETPPEFAFSVTGMDRFVAAERILINPTLTPDVGAPAAIDTVKTWGVVPDCGVTVSQPC
jgi:hypothetical protein